MIGQQLGHYEILGKLGEGGMGTVYLAADATLDRRVALKVLPEDLASDPGRLERFEREAKAVAALNHPNIVTVHSIEEAEGRRILTMELVEGRTLGQLIPDSGLDVADFLRLAIPLADAVAAAHDKSIIHRDLKPANIMVTDEDARLKILDFGLAKFELAESDDPEATLATLAASHALTQAGAVLGTFPYMSPEQLEAQAVDHRTDIFSLGVIFYEMATGRRPFVGDSTAALVSAILRDAPRPLAELRDELPPQLGRIVAHCLEKNPRRRFQSARDVFNELRALRQELESVVEPVTGSTPQPPSAIAETPVAISRRTLAAVAVGLVLLVATIVAVLQFGRAQAPAEPEAIVSIVALPSRVFGSDEDAFLADAVPSTLSTHLAKLEGVSTRLPSTSQRVDALAGDLDKLARAFEVGAFVLSDISADASQLVLNVQVVAAGSRSLLWSHEYEGRRDAYLDVVRQAAEGVCGYLRPSALPLMGAVTGTAGTSEAELAYRRGKYFTDRFNNKHRAEDFDKALAALESALALEPRHAPAAAEIANLYIFKLETGDVERPGKEVLQSIEDWTRRALELDPESSTGWGLLSYLEMRRPDGDRLVQLEYALKSAVLGPDQSYAHHDLGSALGGRLGFEAMMHAARLDPLYLYPKLSAAEYLVDSGRFDEAFALYDEIEQIDDDLPYLSLERATALVALGRIEESRAARAHLEISSAEGRLDPQLPDGLAAGLTIVEALQRRDRSSALAELERFLAWGPGLRLTYAMRMSIYAFASRQDGHAIRLVLERREELGQIDYEYLTLNPLFVFLRGEEWFEQTRRRTRGATEQLLSMVQEARRRGEFPRYLESTLDELLVQLQTTPATTDSPQATDRRTGRAAARVAVAGPDSLAPPPFDPPVRFARRSVICSATTAAPHRVPRERWSAPTRSPARSAAMPGCSLRVSSPA